MFHNMMNNSSFSFWKKFQEEDYSYSAQYQTVTSHFHEWCNKLILGTSYSAVIQAVIKAVWTTVVFNY